jgi:hypothetical protein
VLSLIIFALFACNTVSFQNVAETLRGYHNSVSLVREIAVDSVIIIAKASDGSVLIPFPLDHGVWTQRADRIINNIVSDVNKTSGIKNRFELWVTGTVSPMIVKQLKPLGINVTQNVDERIEFMD